MTFNRLYTYLLTEHSMTSQLHLHLLALVPVDPEEEPWVLRVRYAIGYPVCPVVRQALFLGHRLQATGTDRQLHVEATAVLEEVIPEDACRLVGTSFSPHHRGLDVSQVAYLVGRVALRHIELLAGAKQVHPGPAHLERKKVRFKNRYALTFFLRKHKDIFAFLPFPDTRRRWYLKHFPKEDTNPFILHYIDVTMTTIASQITSLTVVLNRLFRRKSKKTPKLCVTGLCAGNSPGPVNSPHKGPVTRKMIPFDDVIMCIMNTVGVDDTVTGSLGIDWCKQCLARPDSMAKSKTAVSPMC